MAKIQTYLGLGTNLGERLDNLQRAVIGLQAELTITAVSPIYESAAWGVTDQPDFLNMCVGALTDKSPRDLLQFIKTLETELGRKPSFHWGPRLIDIDILFYDQLIMHDELLTIPHVGIPERATVLVPLADIAPEWNHPGTGLSVTEMVTAVDKSGVTPFDGAVLGTG